MKANSKYYARKRELIDSLKTEMGGRCQRCSYDEFLASLALHHIDPSEKEGQRITNLSLTKIRAEADKCALLCMNCHIQCHLHDRTIPWLFKKSSGLGWEFVAGPPL